MKTFYLKLTDGTNVRDYRYSAKYLVTAILDVRKSFSDWYKVDDNVIMVLIAKEIKTK